MKTSDIEYVRLDVPREQIVLSDAIAWEFIMTGEYYSASDTLEALDIELENFRNLNVVERVYTIKRSWERAFDVDPYADFVFGSFWTIEPWMLIRGEDSEI